MMNEKLDSVSAIVASIQAWSDLSRLASFAVKRHGFGDTNGGFGVTYPDDLDEYDQAIDGVSIPHGFVEVYGDWGPPRGYSLFVRESEYLEILVSLLTKAGLHAEAEKVKAVK